MSELYNKFHEHFEVVSADTVGLMEKAFRIRYQVYCVEKSYETAEAYPDGMEIDEYDMHSTHSLVKCQRSGDYAGLVRLVLPNPVDVNTPLPVEKVCHSALQNSGLNLSSIPRERIAEISRFSISKELKRQAVRKASVSLVRDSGKQVKAGDSEIMPHSTLGLFAGVVRMSAQHHITHWLAVMEPTLFRFLSRYGIYFQKVGPVVEYRGRRQPAFANIDSVLSGIHAKRKDAWEIITDFGNVWPLSRGAKHFVFS